MKTQLKEIYGNAPNASVLCAAILDHVARPACSMEPVDESSPRVVVQASPGNLTDTLLLQLVDQMAQLNAGIAGKTSFAPNSHKAAQS